MMTEQDSEQVYERLHQRISSLIDRKDGEISNIPESDKNERHFAQGMAAAYRDLLARLEKGELL